MRTIAFIPLRGGSKSIPLKNIKAIAGKPLCLWVIEAAVACPAIDRVFVATDSPEIAEIARGIESEKLEIVGRSAESASDTAITESVMLEFAATREFDRIVLIQATSPLLRSEDLCAGFEELSRTSADSLLSVVEQKRFIWNRNDSGLATPVNYDFRARPRRQEFSPYFVENGAFYICSRAGLLQAKCRLSGRIALHAMPEETYYELDEPADWAIVESLLGQRRSVNGRESVCKEGRILDPAEFACRASRIKLFLTDVDGVLTDAGMYYSELGDELKKFNTRDGKGIELLRKAGIQTGIITTENTKIVERRAAKLKMDHLIQEAHDKMPALTSILKKTGFSPEEVAYIGDDLADIPVLKAVGFSACPADAVAEVRAVVHFCCQANGGDGAVREFTEVLLESRKDDKWQRSQSSLRTDMN